MSQTPTSLSKMAKFWDIVVLRDDGHWVGFRVPWIALRRVATYLSLVFIACALSSAGWLLSRWQVQRLDKNLVMSRLKIESLESELAQIKNTGAAKNTSPMVAALTPADLSKLSVMPSLGEDEFHTPGVEIKNLSADYAAAKKEWTLRFDLDRSGLTGPTKTDRVYWMALLHAPHGVWVFPSAFGSRQGELLLYDKGQALEESKTVQPVLARFALQDFVEAAGVAPVNVSVFVYDQRGTLLLRSRAPLKVQR